MNTDNLEILTDFGMEMSLPYLPEDYEIEELIPKKYYLHKIKINQERVNTLISSIILNYSGNIFYFMRILIDKDFIEMENKCFGENSLQNYVKNISFSNNFSFQPKNNMIVENDDKNILFINIGYGKNTTIDCRGLRKKLPIYIYDDLDYEYVNFAVNCEDSFLENRIMFEIIKPGIVVVNTTDPIELVKKYNILENSFLFYMQQIMVKISNETLPTNMDESILGLRYFYGRLSSTLFRKEIIEQKIKIPSYIFNVKNLLYLDNGRLNDELITILSCVSKSCYETYKKYNYEMRLMYLIVFEKDGLFSVPMFTVESCKFFIEYFKYCYHHNRYNKYNLRFGRPEEAYLYTIYLKKLAVTFISSVVRFTSTTVIPYTFEKVVARQIPSPVKILFEESKHSSPVSVIISHDDDRVSRDIPSDILDTIYLELSSILKNPNIDTYDIISLEDVKDKLNELESVKEKCCYLLQFVHIEADKDKLMKFEVLDNCLKNMKLPDNSTLYYKSMLNCYNYYLNCAGFENFFQKIPNPEHIVNLQKITKVVRHFEDKTIEYFYIREKMLFSTYKLCDIDILKILNELSSRFVFTSVFDAYLSINFGNMSSLIMISPFMTDLLEYSNYHGMVNLIEEFSRYMKSYDKEFVKVFTPIKIDLEINQELMRNPRYREIMTNIDPSFREMISSVQRMFGINPHDIFS